MALYEFLGAHRDEILRRAIQKIVSSSDGAAGRRDELTDDLPQYFDELIAALRSGVELPSGPPLSEHSRIASGHGRQRYRLGFDITTVVHDYGSICESITEMAIEEEEPIDVREYQILNQSLDNAIADAVCHFQREHSSNKESEHTSRIGFIAHELRNALASAMMSFQLLKCGKAPVGGRTAGVLERSQAYLRDLIDKLLADVRIESARFEREELRLAPLLEEIEASASLQASTKNIGISIEVDPRAQLEGDRQLLASAISNLVQNAVKFTRRGGRVVIRGHVVGADVVVEVEDECGGLPTDATNEQLFAPFVQKNHDRSGLGLGLAITRQAALRHGGSVDVRNLANKGCVFSIRVPVHAPVQLQT